MSQEPAPTSDRDAIKLQTAGFSTGAQRELQVSLVESHQRPIRERNGFERPVLDTAAFAEHSLLVVKDRILVPAEHADRARALLSKDWKGPEPVPCTATRPLRVVRFTAGVAGLRATEAIDALAAADIGANFSHCTPTNPVIKGGSPPVPPNGSTPTWPAGPLHARGPRVAVIDTGLNLDQVDWQNTWLHDIPLLPANRDHSRKSSGVLESGGGHGTFVAGVIRQVAPNATVRVYKGLGSDGLGSEEDVACAILRAADDGADIINLSVGTETYRDRRPVALDAALRALPPNVVVVAAAGNNGATTDRYRPVWPAAFPQVIAVAALTANGRPAAWSSRGPWVSCSIRGEGIVSTFVVGKVPPTGSPTFGPQTPWALWSGTSFAAPQVAGLIALGAANKTAQESAQELLQGGIPLLDMGVKLASPLSYKLA